MQVYMRASVVRCKYVNIDHSLVPQNPKTPIKVEHDDDNSNHI